MKKITISVLCLIFLVSLTACISGCNRPEKENASDILDYNFTLIGKNYTLTSYAGNSNKIKIPSIYNGKAVTVIGERAFYDCSEITEIVLPDTIKEIGKEAFGYCTSLKKIKISACTRLKDKAFIGCTSLTEIYFPEKLIHIGVAPFAECTSLSKISIESEVISDKVFAENKNLKEIVLGSGVTEIAQKAFKDCSSLESITLPFVGASKTANKGYDQVLGYYFEYVISSSSSVSGATYQYCEGSDYYNYYIPASLKTVILSDSVTSIGNNAFV